MFELWIFHNRAKLSEYMRKKIFFLFILAFAVGCNKSDYPTDPVPDPGRQDEEYISKVYLRSICMDIYYYWYKEVKSRNALLDPDKYSITDFFDEMLYEKDRWSWMCDGDYYRSMQTGV